MKYFKRLFKTHNVGQSAVPDSVSQFGRMKKTALIVGLLLFNVSIFGQLPPGWEHVSTPSTQIISVPLIINPNIGGVPLSPGDYIGVFYTDDNGAWKCGGAEEWDGIQNIGIIAFGDDAFTAEKEGFAAGEVITYKIYSYAINMEFFAEVSCDNGLPSLCDSFMSNGLSGVETMQAILNFTPVWNSPYNPMTIYVTAATLDETALQVGDEIGVFDVDTYTGQQICVGVGILTEALQGGAYLEMIASMDDGSFPDQSNGFTPGNDFIFKLFSQSEGLVEDVVVSFPYPGYDENFASQGSAFVELMGETIPMLSFEPVWTSPYNPMTFYITGALLDGLNLDTPAQIGIFDIDPNNSEEICVGAAILEGIVSPESYLEIIASMDDGGLVDEANGFTPGHSFIFKMISEAGVLIEQVDYSFPYPDYDEVFTSQGSSIVNLSGTSGQGEQQIISLNQGWTGVSSYLEPANPAIQNVSGSIAGELEMIQNNVAFYQPGNGASTLNTWNYQSGYFIKVSQAADLIINGNAPASTSISLTTGWNLIPVLSNQAVAVADIFAGNLAKVEIIKDAVGLEVYWAAKGITTLEDLQVGKAYLVKASESFTITF